MPANDTAIYLERQNGKPRLSASRAPILAFSLVVFSLGGGDASEIHSSHIEYPNISRLRERELNSDTIAKWKSYTLSRAGTRVAKRQDIFVEEKHPAPSLLRDPNCTVPAIRFLTDPDLSTIYTKSYTRSTRAEREKGREREKERRGEREKEREKENSWR